MRNVLATVRALIMARSSELAHCLLQYYLCQLGQKQAGQEKGVAFVESSLGAVEFEQK
jgi:hypothetical protein